MAHLLFPLSAATQDADYDAIQEEFLELEKLSQKLAQSAQKYKEAFLGACVLECNQSLLNHQRAHFILRQPC